MSEPVRMKKKVGKKERSEGDKQMYRKWDDR